MSKQGQHPTSPAERVSETDRQALDRFRHDLADVRGELDALQQDAHTTIAEVKEAFRPVAPLTDSAHALSAAIRDLEYRLKTFAQKGKPLYLGPPPVPLGDRLIVTALFLLGLFVVGLLLFGWPADRPPRRDVAPLILPPPILDPLPPPREIVPPLAPVPQRDPSEVR